MRSVALVAGEVAAPHDIIQSPRVTSASLGADATSGAVAVSIEEALVQLRCATELGETAAQSPQRDAERGRERR
jgi:hypothetical protein